MLGEWQSLDEAFRVSRVGASEDAGPNQLELARPTVVDVAGVCSAGLKRQFAVFGKLLADLRR
ncbi:MAG: hypothetical protein XU10_C0002G0134 [Chloroflexi bacterium CSP1-4]|nr:MAG: hypothetical protein XU10_C0002G0134 [Chloroflexi bacterium CSP1-4]